VTRAVASALVLAACGGGHGTSDIDAPPADARAACTATWSGNFAEVATSDAACATLTASGTASGAASAAASGAAFDATSGAASAAATLAIQAPTTRLPAPLPIAIQLAAVVAGTYSSENIGTWSASETRTIVGDTCLFEAGSDVAPHGNFTLTLTDATAPHGTLALELAVLAKAQSVCGDPLSEQLELAF
jgi:hypothetical protein